MTKERIMAAVAILAAVYEAILAAGSKGIPSGTLYALMMSRIDLATYQSMVNALKSKGLVTDDGFLLRAVALPLKEVA